MNIADFASLAAGGISRENRFQCEGRAVPAGFEHLIQTAQLPGIQFHTGLYRNVGAGVKYINNVFYNDLTITFIDTEDMGVQAFYNDWIREVYPGKGQIAYKEVYAKELIITKLTRFNRQPIKYNFIKIFPINISDVALNTASQNTASQLTVTFAYDSWESAGGGAPIQGTPF